MYIVNIMDIQSLIVVFIAFLSLVSITKFAFSRVIRRLCLTDNQYCVGVYISIRQVEVVLYENIFFFLIFRWHFALLFWGILYAFNSLLFRSVWWSDYMQKNYKHSILYETKPVQKNAIVLISEKDVRMTIFGYIFYNQDYAYNWIKVHTTAVSFLWCPILLQQFRLLSIDETIANRFLTEVYDLAVLGGLASIIYWLTYFLCRYRTLKYKNWRKEHFKDFQIICVFLLLFYLVAKIL